MGAFIPMNRLRRRARRSTKNETYERTQRKAEHDPDPSQQARHARQASAARRATGDRGGQLGRRHRGRSWIGLATRIEPPSVCADEAISDGLDPIALTRARDVEARDPSARECVVSEFERRYVDRVVARHGGHVTAAARASGVEHLYFQLVARAPVGSRPRDGSGRSTLDHGITARPATWWARNREALFIG